MFEGLGPRGFILRKEMVKAQSRYRRESKQGATDLPAEGCTDIELVQWFRERIREECACPDIVRRRAVVIARSEYARKVLGGGGRERRGKLKFPPDEEILSWYDSRREVIEDNRLPQPPSFVKWEQGRAAAAATSSSSPMPGNYIIIHVLSLI